MKPLIITDDFKAEALKRFTEELGKYNGNGSFNFNFAADVAIPAEYKTIRPKVYFTPVAYLKMNALISTCNKEIAWHGYVEVLDEHVYLITDALCYPQKVAGAAVDSDDDKYGAWLQNIPNDKIKSLRFQGHSHVNMGVSPSATDVENWHNLTKLVRDDGYYIFCIANKKGSIEFHLADKKLGVMFEPKEIDYAVLISDSTEVTLKAWANNAIEEYISEIKTISPVLGSTVVSNPNYNTRYTGGFNSSVHPYAYSNDKVSTTVEFNRLYANSDVEYVPEMQAFVSDDFISGFRWDSGFGVFKKEVTDYLADLYDAGELNTINNKKSKANKKSNTKGGKK